MLLSTNKLKASSMDNKKLYLKGDIGLDKKDFLAIIGSNRLLRSNYLYLLSGLLPVEYGNLFLFDKNLYNISYELIQRIRIRTGFIFDEGGLISNISIYDNMVLPLRYHFKTFSKKYLHTRVDKFLKRFSLFEYKNLRPGAIDKEIYKLCLYCRAFILNPILLFINEPIEYLSLNYRKYIIDYLFSLQYNSGKVIVASFSDLEVAYKMANKFLVLHEGTYYKYYSTKDELLSSIQEDLYIRELFKGCGV